LDDEENEISGELGRHVIQIAGQIGVRTILRYEGLLAAAEYLEQQFQSHGLETRRQTYEADGASVWNLETEIHGTDLAHEIVVVGAHYDSHPGCPAANDNGSGLAAMLSMARHFSKKRLRRTLRFVAFVNEETPYYHSELMGSLVYAKRCRANADRIRAMISLETIGYYALERGTQIRPFPFGFLYPDQANFIAFVSRFSDWRLVGTMAGSFRKNCDFPCHQVFGPQFIRAVGASDHWSFWQCGYPAMMITDTANFRYRQFHTPEDLPDKLNYPSFARVVKGLLPVVESLCMEGA